MFLNDFCIINTRKIEKYLKNANRDDHKNKSLNIVLVETAIRG